MSEDPPPKQLPPAPRPPAPPPPANPSLQEILQSESEGQINNLQKSVEDTNATPEIGEQAPYDLKISEIIPEPIRAPRPVANAPAESLTPNVTPAQGTATELGSAPTTTPEQKPPSGSENAQGTAPLEKAAVGIPNTADTLRALPEYRNLKPEKQRFMDLVLSKSGLDKMVAKYEILGISQEIQKLVGTLAAEEKELEMRRADRKNSEDIILQHVHDIELIKSESKIPLPSNAFDTLIVNRDIEKNKLTIEHLDSVGIPTKEVEVQRLRTLIEEKTRQRSQIAEQILTKYDTTLEPARSEIERNERELSTLTRDMVALEIDQEEKAESLDRIRIRYESIQATLKKSGWSASTISGRQGLRSWQETITKEEQKMQIQRAELQKRIADITAKLRFERQKIQPKLEMLSKFRFYVNRNELNEQTPPPESSQTTSTMTTEQQPEVVKSEESTSTSEPEVLNLEEKQVMEEQPSLKVLISRWNEIQKGSGSPSAETKKVTIEMNEYLIALRGAHKSNHSTDSPMKPDRFLKFTEAFLKHKKVEKRLIDNALKRFTEQTKTKK